MKYIVYLALLTTSSVQSLSPIMPTKYLDERRNNQDFGKMELMHEEEMQIRHKLFRNKVRNAHYSHVKEAAMLKNKFVDADEKFSNGFIAKEEELSIQH